jgi:hypothetical protein
MRTPAELQSVVSRSVGERVQVSVVSRKSEVG